jgi:hypothetical protein
VKFQFLWLLLMQTWINVLPQVDRSKFRDLSSEHQSGSSKNSF